MIASIHGFLDQFCICQHYRVGLGLGLVYGIFPNDRTYIFSDGPWIFEFWTTAIHTWSNVIKTQQYVPIKMPGFTYWTRVLAPLSGNFSLKLRWNVQYVKTVSLKKCSLSTPTIYGDNTSLYLTSSPKSWQRKRVVGWCAAWWGWGVPTEKPFWAHTKQISVLLKARFSAQCPL